MVEDDDCGNYNDEMSFNYVNSQKKWLSFVKC